MKLHIAKKNDAFYKQEYQKLKNKAFDDFAIKVEQVLRVDQTNKSNRILTCELILELQSSWDEYYWSPTQFYHIETWIGLLHFGKYFNELIEQSEILCNKYVLKEYMLQPNYIWTRYALKSLSFFRYPDEKMLYVKQKACK